MSMSLIPRTFPQAAAIWVCDAAAMAAQGVEPEEIKRRLEAVVPKVNASFVIDQLDYLAKGGRCSAVTQRG